MQIQQLRYFLAVAEHGHFTRAADEVGVAQPSLSKQIQALEHELGSPLFERERGNVALTPAGTILLPHARSVLADVDTAHREVQRLIGLRRGRVRLGAPPSLCTSLVAEVLRTFSDAYPGVELFVEESASPDLVADLARGELDLALVITPEQLLDPSLVVEPLLREGLVVASSVAVPPAGLPDSGPVRVAELRDQAFVLFRAGYDLREVTLELCRHEGFTPRLAIEGGEMDAVLSFVEAGLGIALVPSTVLPGRARLRVTELAPPGAYRTVAVAHRRAVAMPHAARALRDTLDAYLRDAAAAGTLPAGVERIEH